MNPSITGQRSITWLLLLSVACMLTCTLATSTVRTKEVLLEDFDLTATGEGRETKSSTVATTTATTQTITTTSESPSENINDLSSMDSYARIVGGNRPSRDSYPYFVRVDHNGGLHCGGVLIAPNLVLTAAHCVVGSGYYTAYYNAYNIYATYSGMQARGVTKAIRSPTYSSSSFDNDIAILKLASPVTNPKLAPINENELFPQPGNSLTVIGVGDAFEYGASTAWLHEVDVNVVPHSLCNANHYGDVNDATMFCARNPGKDACQGDSGGPIFQTINGLQTVVGIVSWGRGCAESAYPGVYARTSTVTAWINMMKNQLTPQTPAPLESSSLPSSKPSDAPTVAASVVPTMLVSSSPSNNPTVERSAIPSRAPSTRPSAVASVQPSEVPSGGPSSGPSNKPSIESSSIPSSKPSDAPTVAAAAVLTAPPATRSSLIPSNDPSVEWSAYPSPAPSSHPSTVPSGNDFVDSSKGSISGNVTSTDGIPIPNIVITLTDSNGNIVTTTTGTTGEYAFENLAPGNYSLTAESHASGTHNEVDNRIEVTLEGGSRNQGNNFVMTLEPKIPTSGPSENPPAVAPVTSVPTAHVALSKYCEELDTPGCGLCTAFHSPDYCNPHESFASLIQNRTHQCRSDPGTVASDGYWFHYLEDKIAGYVLSIDQSAPAPKIFCCVTSHDQLRECLENRVIPENPNGIVIKATRMHSNQGVFVLVNDTKSSADDPIDLLTGLRMSYIDAVTALTYFQASKIIVEEFIGTSLPTEYKFHVINGKVAAIDIIDGRGSECPCYAVVDTNWTRLDQFGCFEPGGFELVDSDTGCTAVDWKTGKRKAGPIKKDLNMCDEVPKPSNCLVQDMSAIALKLGNRIGVAMRIDMFVEDDTIYVQEYSPNHMKGIRHCAAKMENGCIDSCFLGRMWDAAGGDYGGDLTTVPLDLLDYHTLTAQQQCDLLMGKNPPIVAKSC